MKHYCFDEFVLASCLIETETDALTRLIPFLCWYISNHLNVETLSATGRWSDDRPQDGAKGDGSRRYVLGNCSKTSLKSLPNSIALTLGVNGEVEKTKWKGYREDGGQNLNAIKER